MTIGDWIDAVNELSATTSKMLEELAREHGINEENAHKWILASVHEGDRHVQWFQLFTEPRRGPHGKCVVVSPEGVRIEDRGSK